MRKSRKNDTSVEKVAILRRHLIDRASISDRCDEYQLSPTLFYAWQKLFFDRESMTEAEVAHYNEVRLHSAIGYVTPADKLAGRERTIFEERDRKLDAARERRRAAREASRTTTST